MMELIRSLREVNVPIISSQRHMHTTTTMKMAAVQIGGIWPQQLEPTGNNVYATSLNHSI
eukprot:m.37787 g.37787  ORF g.37787 m.37787 type:complete len:60 (-) comp9351_c0_seq1:67-246(-)